MEQEIVDRRVRRTRAAIREALQDLLKDNVIEQISAKEIAAAADIGYTTFFRHFPTKEAAFADLADSEAAALIEECFPLARSNGSEAASLTLCQHVDRKRRVWSALLTGGAAGIVREALIRHTVDRVDEWPSVKDWLPPATGTPLIIGLLVEVLTWWLTYAQDMRPEQVANIMDKLFIARLVEETPS